MQDYLCVEEAIQRARSLVAPHVTSPRAIALSDIDSVVRATVAATMTSDLSGAFVNRHNAFAIDNAANLRAAEQTDGTLGMHLKAAESLTRYGVERLDGIAVQAHATAEAGTAATTPAVQRVILTALRTQLARATAVIDSIRQQGAGLAGHVRSLQYEPPATPPPLGWEFPTGPTVWCLRPKGMFGYYRCSVLYPDLSVGTYWSPSDDSGGSYP